MQVRATARGYFDGQIKEVGDVFMAESKAFSSEWMEPLEPIVKAKHDKHKGDGA